MRLDLYVLRSVLLGTLAILVIVLGLALILLFLDEVDKINAAYTLPKAVLFVVAERDWLLSLWEAGVICRSQCERLAVLLDLCPVDSPRRPQAEDVRKVAQTLPGPGHLQCGGCARACGFGESSSGGRPL